MNTLWHTQSEVSWAPDGEGPMPSGRQYMLSDHLFSEITIFDIKRPALMVLRLKHYLSRQSTATWPANIMSTTDHWVSK